MPVPILSSDLAPGFIRLTYSGTVLPHHMIIPINFDGTPTPGVEPDLQTSSAASTPFTVGLVDFVTNALVTQFPATVKFGLADIYKVDATTGERTFIYTHNVDLIGTSTDPVVPNTQAVWWFKTTNGGKLKVTTMESVYFADTRNVGSVPADARQDIIDFITGPDNIHYGRKNAYPLAFMSFVSKINDVLRKRQGFTDV